jgi:hypothetical protein
VNENRPYVSIGHKVVTNVSDYVMEPTIQEILEAMSINGRFFLQIHPNFLFLFKRSNNLRAREKI